MPALLDLPDHLLRLVGGFLDVSSMAALACSCRTLRCCDPMGLPRGHMRKRLIRGQEPGDWLLVWRVLAELHGVNPEGATATRYADGRLLFDGGPNTRPLICMQWCRPRHREDSVKRLRWLVHMLTGHKVSAPSGPPQYTFEERAARCGWCTI